MTNPFLFQELMRLKSSVEKGIHSTPTGKLRESLTEVNIMLTYIENAVNKGTSCEQALKELEDFLHSAY